MSLTYARTFRLSFETPRPGGDVVIRAELHHIAEDEAGEVTFISGTQHEMFRLLSAIATDPVQFVDPTTGQQHELTVAAIANAVTEAVRDWFPDEIEGEFGPEPDRKYIVSQE